MFNRVERVDRVELLHVSTCSTRLIILGFYGGCPRQVPILATKNRRKRRMFNHVEHVDRVGLLQGLSPPSPNLGHKEQEKQENV